MDLAFPGVLLLVPLASLSFLSSFRQLRNYARGAHLDFPGRTDLLILLMSTGTFQPGAPLDFISATS